MDVNVIDNINTFVLYIFNTCKNYRTKRDLNPHVLAIAAEYHSYQINSSNSQNYNFYTYHIRSSGKNTKLVPNELTKILS